MVFLKTKSVMFGLKVDFCGETDIHVKWIFFFLVENMRDLGLNTVLLKRKCLIWG